VGEAGAEVAAAKPEIVAGGGVGVTCAATAVGVAGGGWPAQPMNRIIAVTTLIALSPPGKIFADCFISHSFSRPIGDEILPEDSVKEK
jgi:hypothetical protein